VASLSETIDPNILASFSDEVFEEILTVAPTFLPGLLEGVGENGQAVEVEEGRNSFEFEGSFIVGDAASIPDDTLLFVFGPSGLVSQTLVNPDSGSFRVVITDVPSGITSYIFIVSSPSSERRSLRTGRRELVQSVENPCTKQVINPNCEPAVSFTLRWTGATSDIDLYVTEPLTGEVVWFGDQDGVMGDIDVDDVEGFGPENYKIYSDFQIQEGETFLIRLNAFDLDQETSVTWTLDAFERGELVWTHTGIFVSDSHGSEFPASAWYSTQLVTSARAAGPCLSQVCTVPPPPPPESRRTSMIHGGSTNRNSIILPIIIPNIPPTPPPHKWGWVECWMYYYNGGGADLYLQDTGLDGDVKEAWMDSCLADIKTKIGQGGMSGSCSVARPSILSSWYWIGGFVINWEAEQKTNDEEYELTVHFNDHFDCDPFPRLGDTYYVYYTWTILVNLEDNP
jgi:hypothetical protein